MVVVRSIAFAIACCAGINLASPLAAQTSATLNLTVRVVDECTVKSKRELVRLARQRNDPSLIRRCSKGVLSRVNQRVIKASAVRASAPVPRNTTKKSVKRSTVSGETDVVLVTVTY